MECHLITGGAGFIGSNYVLNARRNGIKIINLDKLTYAGNLQNLAQLEGDAQYKFIHGGIENAELVAWILNEYKPQAIINFAAESHVDRSIVDPEAFVRTNVLGTATLLRVINDWWKRLHREQATRFRFLHISTDEVYGSLGINGSPFTEKTPYAPNSPYSASKAASDHLIQAFHETYGFPALLTNCSNNYGPRQFPEKLIPLVILNALEHKALPIYGQGNNIRDWLHVDDHCEAIRLVLNMGQPGEKYNIGGHAELTNLEIVKKICSILDNISPGQEPHSKLITFVPDRLGHDFRYAINCSKIEQKLGLKPKHDIESGLVETVNWYLNNIEWVKNVRTGAYHAWIQQNYSSTNRTK